MKLARIVAILCAAALFPCGTIAMSEAFKLPDTGQKYCYDTYGSVISCAGTGQDGEYDINPLSYTDNGDGTVTDNNTGIMWQKCSAGQNNDAACNGLASYYNWYAASGTYDSKYNPSPTDVCGSLVLGSYSDWRLPSKKELMSLVDYSTIQSIFNPPIDVTYFPNTRHYFYWSSTASAFNPLNSWYVSFEDGSVYGNFDKSYSICVRCVRAGQYPAQSLIDNGDGTVTDNATGLMWQQGEPGPMGRPLDYCADLSLGGHSDWRLPNIKELESLTDDSRFNPAIDTNYFPNAISDSPYWDDYWSSTSIVYSNTKGDWSVGFYYGDVTGGGHWVRCVRGPLNRKPTLGTVTPFSVTTKAGTPQRFTAVYRDVDGYADLKTVDFLVSPNGTGEDSIWARYDAVKNKIYLYNDTGTKAVGNCTPGVAGSLQNSQGKINCGGTTVTKTGERVIVKWSITPKVSFASTTAKQLKMKAVDMTGATTGWKLKGSWTVSP